MSQFHARRHEVNLSGVAPSNRAWYGWGYTSTEQPDWIDRPVGSRHEGGDRLRSRRHSWTQPIHCESSETDTTLVRYRIHYMCLRTYLMQLARDLNSIVWLVDLAGVLLFASSCLDPRATTVTDSKATPAIISEGLPTANPNPGITVSPTYRSTAAVTLTLPILTPTIPSCQGDSLVFLGQDITLYLACADGSSIYKILSIAPKLPSSSWSVRSMALSSDRQWVALSAHDANEVEIRERLFVVSLVDNSTHEIHSADYV